MIAAAALPTRRQIACGLVLCLSACANRGTVACRTSIAMDASATIFRSDGPTYSEPAAIVSGLLHWAGISDAPAGEATLTVHGYQPVAFTWKRYPNGAIRCTPEVMSMEDPSALIVGTVLVGPGEQVELLGCLARRRIERSSTIGVPTAAGQDCRLYLHQVEREAWQIGPRFTPVVPGYNGFRVLRADATPNREAEEMNGWIADSGVVLTTVDPQLSFERGDTVTQIGGHRVGAGFPDTLHDALWACRSGGGCAATVLRDGEVTYLEVPPLTPADRAMWQKEQEAMRRALGGDHDW